MPMATVMPCESPRCRIRCPSWWKVLPSVPSIPNSFGSCFTVTKIASPKTKPSITGLERNWAMKPSPMNPASRKRPPQNRIIVAASTA